MLKTTKLSDKPASSRNDGSKSAFNKNNNNKLAFGRNNGNGKIDRFSVGGNGIEHTKKSEKLFQSRKLKSKKTSISRNLAKSGKKLSKSRNLTNFNATKVRSKFLTFDTKIAFNRI